MDDSSEKILYRGLLRPAMVLGVTLDFFTVNVLFTLILFILTSSFFILILCFPFHLFGVIACKLDPFIFRLIAKRCLCLPGRLYTAWGCQSYEP